MKDRKAYLRSYYLANREKFERQAPDLEHMSRADVAEKLGVTPERIGQIERSALAKIEASGALDDWSEQ